MFYVDWELEGQKQLKGMDFFLVNTCKGRVTASKQLFKAVLLC